MRVFSRTKELRSAVECRVATALKTLTGGVGAMTIREGLFRMRCVLAEGDETPSTFVQNVTIFGHRVKIVKSRTPVRIGTS